MSDSHDINCLHGDPDNHITTGAERVLPVDLALAVTFGAPRFLWHGRDEA